MVKKEYISYMIYNACQIQMYFAWMSHWTWHNRPTDSPKFNIYPHTFINPDVLIIVIHVCIL